MASLIAFSSSWGMSAAGLEPSAGAACPLHRMMSPVAFALVLVVLTATAARSRRAGYGTLLGAYLAASQPRGRKVTRGAPIGAPGSTSRAQRP